MPILAFTLTVLSQCFISYLLMGLLNLKFATSIAVVLGVQLSIWVMYSISSWITYFISTKTALIDLLFNTFINNQFPMIYNEAGECLDPEEYLATIISNDKFSTKLRLIANGINAEILSLEKIGQIQTKWRVQRALELSLNKYYNSKISADTYRISQYGSLHKVKSTEDPPKRQDSYKEWLKLEEDGFFRQK